MAQRLKRRRVRRARASGKDARGERKARQSESFKGIVQVYEAAVHIIRSYVLPTVVRDQRSYVLYSTNIPGKFFMQIFATK